MKKFTICLTLATSLLFTGSSIHGTTLNQYPTTNSYISYNYVNNNSIIIENRTPEILDESEISNSPSINNGDLTLSPDEAIKNLEEGNARFFSDKSEVKNVSASRRNELKAGQNPYAVIVSCSDSRVAPELIFNAGLGEIFGVRLAGNVVDSDALGSIEYAVSNLKTPLIVVIGHEKCGAVEAAYNKVKKHEKLYGNIKSISKKIEPSAEKSSSVDEAIHKNIENVTNEIKNNKVVKKLIDDKKLKVISGYYSLDGKITLNK